MERIEYLVLDRTHGTKLEVVRLRQGKEKENKYSQEITELNPHINKGYHPQGRHYTHSQLRDLVMRAYENPEITINWENENKQQEIFKLIENKRNRNNNHPIVQKL